MTTGSIAKSVGLVGRKAGMTRVFTEAGESVPVTVIQALPNRVKQLSAGEWLGQDGIDAELLDQQLRRSLAAAEPRRQHENRSVAACLQQPHQRSRSTRPGDVRNDEVESSDA